MPGVVTCPNCGSPQVMVIYEDPIMWQCEDCGEVFGE